MARSRLLYLLLLLPIFPAGGALAANGAQAEPLDPVIVKGKRGGLAEMRQEMVQLEERFFARYNELNTRDEFDTHCHQEARLGTRFERRYCRAVFEAEAFEKEARDFALFAQRSTSPDGSPVMLASPEGRRLPPVWGGPPAPAIMDMEPLRKEYRANMVSVVSKHPELIEMARQRSEMEAQYEDARRKAFGLKPVRGNSVPATSAPAQR